MEDKHIGKKGTKERDEYELRMELLGHMIRATRKEQNMTQEELGKLIGVNKSQISKIENHANSATIETILKVFKALSLAGLDVFSISAGVPIFINLRILHILIIQ